MDEASLYSAIGEDGFTRLVAAFYRQVPDDDILGPMYPPEDMAGAEERLRDFLVGRFGGPPRYMLQRGHPRLRQRHFRFEIDARGARRWLELMDRALVETQLGEEAEAVLRPFFVQIAAMMVNRE
jgi:hemoglobin